MNTLLVIVSLLAHLGYTATIAPVDPDKVYDCDAWVDDITIVVCHNPNSRDVQLYVTQ